MARQSDRSGWTRPVLLGHPNEHGKIGLDGAAGRFVPDLHGDAPREFGAWQPMSRDWTPPRTESAPRPPIIARPATRT